MSAELKVQEQSNNSREVSTVYDKDNLRSLFMLMNGKPDSRVKVFNESAYIEPKDIIELKVKVDKKLKVHDLESLVITVTVNYKGADTQEFGSWSEFESEEWLEPERIEEIVVKWDFLLSIKEYEAPQRHTLLFRVANNDMKTGKLLQMLSSSNSDDYDKIDMLSSPAFCRVDFINSQISKELINVVESWYSARKSPALIPDMYFWLKQRRQGIAVLFHHFIPLTYTFLWVGLLYGLSADDSNMFSEMKYLFVWAFVGIALLQPVYKLGHVVAVHLFTLLDEIEGSKVVFSFTSGDKKHEAEIFNTNKAKGKSFMKSSLWTIFLNLLSTAIAAYFISN